MSEKANVLKKNLSLNDEKYIAIGIARDLCYSDIVIDRIKNAKSTIQIENIMIDARRKEA